MKKVKDVLIVLIHAFIGWAVCGGIVGIGQAVTSMENTIFIHAIGVPILFTAISLVYFKKFNKFNEWQTAIIFLGFVILMDVLVVALFIEKSFEMFASPLGTWIPFGLIFLSTYLTGFFIRRQS